MEDNTLDNIEVQEPLKSSCELKNELWKAITDANVACDKSIEQMQYGNDVVKVDSEFKTNLIGLLINENDYPLYMNLGNSIKQFNSLKELKDFANIVQEHTESQYTKCWQTKKAINEEYAILIKEAEEREAKEQEENVSC